MRVITQDFKPLPYWWEAAPPIDGSRDEPGRSYDAVVVGSGVTGLSAALALAEGGRQVLVLDANQIGSGASSRNNGSIIPFHFLHQEKLEQKFGAEAGVAVGRMAVEAFEHLLTIPPRYGFDPMIKSYERYFVACTPKHYKHLAADAILQSERGIGLNWVPVDSDELIRATGLKGYHGGLRIENSMAMHPAMFIAGLRDAAIRAGVEMVGNCRVLKIEPGAGQTTLRTERGEVKARNVVLATNGYSDSAVPFLKNRIVPARLFLSATEPVDPALMRKYFPDRQIADSKLSMSWIRPTPDGTRLMVGGRGGMMGNDPEVHARKLHGDMVQMVPELEDLKLTHVWYGMIGFPMDFVPHIGEVDGMHYSAGYCGVGMCLGNYMGDRLGKRILGRPASESATAADQLKFRKIPGPSALTALYSRLGIEWHNLRDWWDLRQQ